MIEAIYKAHEVNQTIIEFIDKIVAEVRQAKACLRRAAQFRRSCSHAIKEIVPPEEMEEAVFTDDKQTREENIRQITENVWKRLLQIKKSGWLFLGEAVYQYQKKTVRKMILKDHKRPDGRADHPDPSAGCRS